MVRRRLPRPHELAPLLRLQRPELSARARRLRSAHTIHDLRRIAKRRTPRAAFDYCDGGADAEISLARGRAAYADLEFNPRVLRDVSEVDTGWDVLGRRSSYPFAIAPIGFTRLMHTEGERAGAAAAAELGIPFTLSTMGTTSIEDVAAVSGAGRRWFQLYLWTDRDRSSELVRRADRAGFDTLLVTVDTPVAGNRLRDVRNGMTIPPTLTPRTILDAVPRPGWWLDFLTTEPISFASLDRHGGTIPELVSSMFDPALGYDDLRWLRSFWPGKIMIKGIQSLADARLAADAGVDGIVLSNHGGRQLDRAPVPFHLLPDVVREVGDDLEVHVDTGVMSGADVVAAVALGARNVLVGRAYLYGLMAGGRAGVDRALHILTSGFRRTMQLLGVARLEELEPAHVTQLRRLLPLRPDREVDP